jgi:hypothetical protein
LNPLTVFGKSKKPLVKNRNNQNSPTKAISIEMAFIFLYKIKKSDEMSISEYDSNTNEKI